MQHANNPTPYPAINTLLDHLLREVRGILGAAFVGMYLYGSLSGGDFDPASSDVDFLVVTEQVLPEQKVAALGEMHARIAASGMPWADRLEGSYIPRAAIRRYDPANNRHPTIGNDWDFGVGEHNASWVIERQIVRERGVALAGPPAKTLIDSISPDDLRAATWEMLNGFWRAQLDGPEPAWLRSRHYQAFAILTMCRALYTLARGAVVSKPAAAAWAQNVLPPPWPPLIATALIWRHDTRPDDMAAMLSFIRYTLDRTVSEGDEQR